MFGFSVLLFISCFLLRLSYGSIRRHPSQCPYYNGVDVDLNGLPPMRCARAPIECPRTSFQSLDGSCNNLKHPEWGMAYASYARLLPARYGDNQYTIATAMSGAPLPNVRNLSLVMHDELSVPDVEFSLINMQFGQVVAHDNALKAGSSASLRNLTHCCTPDGRLQPPNTPLNKHCLPIAIAADDPIFGPVRINCMEFTRTVVDREVGCADCAAAPANQLNAVTSYLDHSSVYGLTVADSNALRQFSGGQLQTSGDRLPKQAYDAHDLCNVESPDAVCFNDISDPRLNQSPDLAVLQTIFQREHNRLAAALAELNPHWCDEQLFQVARRINIATYQYVTYYEWLPIWLGRSNMLEERLIFENVAGRYVNDYDDLVNVATLNEHSTAAFRYSHTNIEGNLQFMREDRTLSCPVQRLRDWFNDPKILTEPNNVDNILRGMCTQPMQATDRHVSPDIHNYLFNYPYDQPSMDLIALDIQRGRDHGLPSYNSCREWAGMKRASCWEDFLDTINPQAVDLLQKMYEHWDDCDLMVAGSMERHVVGTQAGPVFLDIMLEQFRRFRQGDRFFFEHGECKYTRFTMEQLTEIRKASMARFVCDNANVCSMQKNAFKLISRTNPLRSCATIPRVDLRAWQEPQLRVQKPLASSRRKHANVHQWDPITHLLTYPIGVVGNLLF